MADDALTSGPQAKIDDLARDVRAVLDERAATREHRVRMLGMVLGAVDKVSGMACKALTSWKGLAGLAVLCFTFLLAIGSASGEEVAAIIDSTSAAWHGTATRTTTVEVTQDAQLEE